MGSFEKILICIFLSISTINASIFLHELTSQQIKPRDYIYLECVPENRVQLCYWSINEQRRNPSARFNYINTYTKNCSVNVYGRDIESGYFSCVVEYNNTIYRSREATIIISDFVPSISIFTGGIKNVIHLKEYFVFKEESHDEVYCRINNFAPRHPEMDMWWELDGKKVSSAMYILNKIWISRLTESIQRQHFGKKLTCNFKYHGFPANTTQTASVIVFGKLDSDDIVISEQQERSDNHGQLLAFKCPHKMEMSATRCYWEHIRGHFSFIDDYDGRTIETIENNQSCDGQYLNVSKDSRQFYGLWYCVVLNGTHLSKSKPILFLYERYTSTPEIWIDGSSSKFDVNLILPDPTFVAECSVKTTAPGTTLRWLLNGKEVDGMIRNVTQKKLPKHQSRRAAAIFTTLSGDKLNDIGEEAVLVCEAAYSSYLGSINKTHTVDIKRISPDVKSRNVFAVEPSEDIEVNLASELPPLLKCSTVDNLQMCSWIANSKFTMFYETSWSNKDDHMNPTNCDANRTGSELELQDGYLKCSVLVGYVDTPAERHISKAAKVVILEYLKPIPVVHGGRKVIINNETIVIVNNRKDFPSVEFLVKSFWARNSKATLMLNDEQIALDRQVIEELHHPYFNVIVFKSVQDMTDKWFGKKLKLSVYHTLKNGTQFEASATVSIKVLETNVNNFKTEPEDTVVHPNETVTLNCISNTKYDSCFWEMNDKQITRNTFFHYKSEVGSNCSLTLSKMNSTLNGLVQNFVCNVIVGHIVKSSRNAALTYLVKPVGPHLFVNYRILTRNGIVSLETNSSKWLQLICQLSHLYPEGKLWLEKNNSSISVVGNYTSSLGKFIGRKELFDQSIEHWVLVDSDWDNTQVRCGATHPAYEAGVQQYSNTMTFLTPRKPQHIELATDKGSLNILAQPNDTVTLSCFAHASPLASYTWQKWVAEDNWQNISSTDTIEIRNELGKFQCLAENEHGHMTSLEAVTINSPPVNVTLHFDKATEKVIYTKENERITLMCEANGYPKPLYIWKKRPNSELNWSVFGYNKIVSFHAQNGQYYCTAQNKYGRNDSDVITIELQGKPKSVVVTSNIGDGELLKVRRDETVSLYCNASGGPKPYYKWVRTVMKDDNHQEEYSFSQNMSFVNLQGKFQCIVSNEYGEVVSDKQFTIEFSEK